MTLARWSPIRDAISLRDAMDRLFEDSVIRPSSWAGLVDGSFGVPVDLRETPDAYHLRADVPGIDPNDIDISVTGDTISLSGEVKASQEMTGEGWLRQERRYGKFQRSFTLPVAIDANKVEASFKHGVLELTLPKAENVRPKQIKITAKP